MGAGTVKGLLTVSWAGAVLACGLLGGGCRSGPWYRQSPVMAASNVENTVRTLSSRQEYDAFVAQSKQPVCIMFKSPVCGACREMAPHLRRVSLSYSGKVIFAFASLMRVDGIGRDLNILGTPTTIVFRDGREIERFVGPMTDEGVRCLVDSAR